MRKELGLSWAQALAHRTKVFSAGLAEQWQLGTQLGVHCPTAKQTVEAANLLWLHTAQAAELFQAAN